MKLPQRLDLTALYTYISGQAFCVAIAYPHTLLRSQPNNLIECIH